MSYILNGVTIRTNDTKDGLKKIDELWNDIMIGRIPILCDSEHNGQEGISPVAAYGNYEADEGGNYDVNSDYDLSILGVRADFFEEMEQKVNSGFYKKYDVSDENGDIGICTRKAWETVWDEQKVVKFTGLSLRIMKAQLPLNTQKIKKHIVIFILQFNDKSEMKTPFSGFNKGSFLFFSSNSKKDIFRSNIHKKCFVLPILSVLRVILE